MADLPIRDQLSLFPVADTIGEAIQDIETRLPITTHNELVTALMVYHNTVLHEFEDSLSNFT